MNVPSFKEDHISQIPALQLLQKLGYTYLSPGEVERLRGGKTTTVLLEDILRKQLKAINTLRLGTGKTTVFSDANIENAIRALKELPMNEGYIVASEKLYYMLTLGITLEQNIDGNRKSFPLQYIDWQEPSNNVFHVAEEYSVMRSTSREHYIPDLVLFINGIPICIIECKQRTIKDPLQQAISQHLRNQQEDGIRNLYVYAQMLLAISYDDGKYATNGSPEKYWNLWKEKFSNEEEEKQHREKLYALVNQPLTIEQKDKLFAERYKYVREYFEEKEKAPVQPVVQDELLYCLCRPERLLDFTFNFILFEAGEKKIARYPQYFGVKKTMQRLVQLENGKRKGGVIWHTTGMGKSLTMVMLAQAIAMEKSIKNPKIVLVTDRTDLDAQITAVFRKCGKFVENATTGQRLVELLESDNDAIITTIVNKFNAAVNKIKKPMTSPDIFVLVDEGHRTQYGVFNIQMQKTMPNACYIAMTGTPLFKKEKSTAEKFGGIIDTYTVIDGVADKVIVPLLYEGRVARMEVNDGPIDTYFNKVTEPLSPYAQRDFKKKYSRADQLNSAEQKIYAICWNISTHFRDNWQGTPFKAQLVCDSKAAAIRYKEYFDEIGIVSTEVLISPPDVREGEASAYQKSGDLVNKFWRKMMDEHGSAKLYEKNLISRFKNQPHPEIIIVVDKLLTGFDEPKNTVLYLTRNLREHKLLQAIARVNRIYPDKDFGYIIDYYGVIENPGLALNMYGAFTEFDEEDLVETMLHIKEEIAKLPQAYEELWAIFKSVVNKRDVAAYLDVLRSDEELRRMFYEKLASYARALKVALSSITFHSEVDEKTINRYKEDLAMFMKLRTAIIQLTSDPVDYKKYEGQIQKLLDTHVTVEKIDVITELVNIYDQEKFQLELEKTTGDVAKAYKIASRTEKYTTERMEEDPAMYKKFSQMIRDTIADYEAKRITEAQYLQKQLEIMHNVLNGKDPDIPAALLHKNAAKAFYGISNEALLKIIPDGKKRREICTEAAIRIEELVRNAVLDNGKPVVDWPFKSSITGKLLIEIGDYLLDEVCEKYNFDLNLQETDEIAEQCIRVAKKQFT